MCPAAPAALHRGDASAASDLQRACRMDTRKLLPMLGLALIACAPSVNGIARQASKAAVDEGAETLERRTRRRACRRRLKTPRFRLRHRR